MVIGLGEEAAKACRFAAEPMFAPRLAAAVALPTADDVPPAGGRAGRKGGDGGHAPGAG